MKARFCSVWVAIKDEGHRWFDSNSYKAKVSAAPRTDRMTLVLSKAVFVQLCRIRGTSRTRLALKVSLIGRRAGKRIVIESARRTEAVGRRSLPKAVGEVLF